MCFLQIDENSCIVQPYYDGGESYPEHHKFSLAPSYKTKPNGSITQTWEAFDVRIAAFSKTAIETNNQKIDIRDFSRFRLFARAPETVKIKLFCNGELVLDKVGKNTIAQIDSEIVTTQKKIESLKYEFENVSETDTTISLFYLGMINEKPRNNVVFDTKWEGFLEENPSVDLFCDSVLTKTELSSLREKVKKEPFKTLYLKTKQKACEEMKKIPEKQIKKTVSDWFRQPNNISAMIELALVGQIERDSEMLKMACRCALSFASCEYWCSDVMETVPKVTWHHRSFTETIAARDICTVLALAGGFLTWHGRNYLANMVIMKALPRIEADFMTMDYIYKSNQGIAFMTGYAWALPVLAQIFPRFEKRIDEAEQLLDEMVNNTFMPDGSIFEGGSYWHYTMQCYLQICYAFSRFRKKSLKEYIGSKLDKVSEFGLSLLDQNGKVIPVNDAHPAIYHSYISALLFTITGDKRWAKLFWLDSESYYETALILMNSVEVPKYDVPIVGDFSYNSTVGYTQVCRDGIHLFVSSGPSNSTHCHCDKGSFVIYKDSKAIVPEITAEYTDACSVVVKETQSHSLAVPKRGEKLLSQRIGNGICSVTEKASFENGVFSWKCDNRDVWDNDVVEENTREIVSDTPNEFIITDQFKFKEEMQVTFRLNLANRNAVRVETLNWDPVNEEVLPLKSGSESICQMVLTSESNKEHMLVTKIIIL